MPQSTAQTRDEARKTKLSRLADEVRRSHNILHYREGQKGPHRDRSTEANNALFEFLGELVAQGIIS